MRASDAERMITTRELTWIVLLVLPIFAFLGGPIWDHSFEIDSAVYWSYAPIPLLVLAALVRRRVWSWGGFLVSSIIALSVKYAITTTVALLLWTIGEPPARAARPADMIAATKPIAAGDGGAAIELALPRISVEHVAADRPLAFRSFDGSLHTV